MVSAEGASISLAAAHAAAEVAGVPLARHIHALFQHALASLGIASSARLSLPLPMVNMISGGQHAGGQLDFQDYLMIPVGASSSTSTTSTRRCRARSSGT